MTDGKSHGASHNLSICKVGTSRHHQERRSAWLHQKGFISNPVGKPRSVLFTEEGLLESERLLGALFGRQNDG